VVFASVRVVLLDAGQLVDVFELVELTDASARVRTPFLFDVGEELRVQIEDNGTTEEARARVAGHIHTGEDTITVLELERSG
jgi:hypothetical protein